MTDRTRLVKIIKHAILMGSQQNDATGLALAEHIADELLLNCDIRTIAPAESLGRRAPLATTPILAN